MSSPPQAGAPVTCDSCRACCCRLEVILADEDDPPATFVATDRWGGEVMRRLGDGWCAALDRATWRCRIYARRPRACRDFAVGEPDCLEARRVLEPDAPIGPPCGDA